MSPSWRMSSVLGGMGYPDPAGLPPRRGFDVWGPQLSCLLQKITWKKDSPFLTPSLGEGESALTFDLLCSEFNLLGEENRAGHEGWVTAGGNEGALLCI